MNDDEVNKRVDGIVVPLVEEIRQLRRQMEMLRSWLDEAYAVIDAYQTPNVDDVTIKED